MKPTMTYEIARASAHDAADRQMRGAGRSRWNVDDLDLATSEFVGFPVLHPQRPHPVGLKLVHEYHDLMTVPCPYRSIRPCEPRKLSPGTIP